MEKTDSIGMSYLVMRWLSNKLFFCDFDDFVQGVSVYVKTSYCFGYDVVAFSQSIKANLLSRCVESGIFGVFVAILATFSANLLSRCVFQSPAWKNVVLATD